MVYFTGRNFLLTINAKSIEFYKDILEYVKGLTGLNYLLCCEHIGSENKHYHMYLQYNNTKKLNSKRLHGCRVDPCYGSAQQNIRYVWAKDDKHLKEGITAALVDEEGEPSYKGGNFSVENVKNMESPDELPAVMYNTWKKIKRDSTVTKAKDFRKNVKVYYIQGPSGVGKTNKAIDLATEFEDIYDCGTDFIKYENGFYLGTTPTAKVAIYDDWRDSHMKPSEFINLIDYNKHWMNIKGDSILNNYLVIIITSVQRLERIYGNVPDEPRRQWERRIQLMDMFPPERIHIGGLPVGYKTNFNNFSYEIKDNNEVVVVDNNN